MEGYPIKFLNLWNKLKDIPTINESIDETFEIYEKGTCIYYLWGDLEERFDVSIGRLMSGLNNIKGEK